jgi:hypothetical protein
VCVCVCVCVCMCVCACVCVCVTVCVLSECFEELEKLQLNAKQCVRNQTVCRIQRQQHEK